jgi:hypothetical protein
MKTLSIAGVIAGALIATALGSSAVAGGAPTGGSPAEETVEWLRDQGYAVQLNGSPNGPLAQCIATGVHGLRDSNIDAQGRRHDASRHTTVHVDIACNTAA